MCSEEGMMKAKNKAKSLIEMLKGESAHTGPSWEDLEILLTEVIRRCQLTNGAIQAK